MQSYETYATSTIKKWPAWKKAILELSLLAHEKPLTNTSMMSKEKSMIQENEGQLLCEKSLHTPIVVYVCHKYSDDPEGNKIAIRKICKGVKNAGNIPFAPQLYLEQFMDEATERAECMDMCLQLLQICDQLHVYGPWVSAGMKDEIEQASVWGIRIIWCGKVV